MKIKNKKCKICYNEFKPYSSLDKVCSNYDCKIEMQTKTALKNLNKIKKEEKTQKAIEKKNRSIGLYTRKDKTELQKLINKLARMIDNYFEFNCCIDCGKPFGNQIDGGHFIGVGANESLRYNLHNIHSQKSDCNQNGLGSGKQLQYLRGIEKRYGAIYGEYLEFKQQNYYPLIKLTSSEIIERKKIVSGLIRNFNTFTFENPIQARQMMNLIIGIYTKDVDF
jgi:hypothetical protein